MLFNFDKVVTLFSAIATASSSIFLYSSGRSESLIWFVAVFPSFLFQQFFDEACVNRSPGNDIFNFS